MSTSTMESVVLMDRAFLVVALPLLFIACIAHIYLLASWNDYKRYCFLGEGAPRETTVLGLSVWLTAWNLWLTAATVVLWAFWYRLRGRQQRKTQLGDDNGSTSKSLPAPANIVQETTNVDHSSSNDSLDEAGINTNNARAADNDNCCDQSALEDPHDIEAGNDNAGEDADEDNVDDANSQNAKEEKKVPHKATKSNDDDPPCFLATRINMCLFQIALPISLTTTIAYSMVLITQPPNASLQIDHENCLSRSDSVMEKDAPTAMFWLVMDRIFSVTAHFLCAFFLLFLYSTKRIDYSGKWFLATAFGTILAIVIGLVHTFHSPVYDVPNIWIAAIQVMIGCAVLEAILKLIWSKCLSKQETN